MFLYFFHVLAELLRYSLSLSVLHHCKGGNPLQHQNLPLKNEDGNAVFYAMDWRISCIISFGCNLLLNYFCESKEKSPLN